MRRCPTPDDPTRPTRRTGASPPTPESRVIDRLSGIPNSVWLDPAWEPGRFLEDDVGTDRFTSLLSRPIHTQYTITQPTVSIGPAAVASPNGKLVMSFGGAHYMSGAAALAALIQGSADYSTVSLSSYATGATRVKFGFARNAASPDDRVHHFVTVAGSFSGLQRNQSGALTQNLGTTAITGGVSVVRTFSETYSASDYDAWINDAPETLSGGGANTRAPAVLDIFSVGCQFAGGAPASFWNGIIAGIVICPGTVLSTDDRVGLQTDLAAYYGY